MGRHLQRQHSGIQFEESHPGCMWGVLHILDYHHWNNVKKMLPHKKHNEGRHPKCKVSQKTIEEKGFLDSEAENFLVEQHSTKTRTSKTNKRSGKAHIRELIAKEMSKEEKHKYRNIIFAARSWMRRFRFFHHVEPSYDSLGEIQANGTNPTRFQDSSLPKIPEDTVTCNKNCTACGTMNDVNYLGHKQTAGKHALFPERIDKGIESSVNQKLMESNQLNRDISDNQVKDYDDVLEIFKVNKEFFIKILQDPDVGTKHFHSLQYSNRNARLTKSGSFPVANSSHTRNIKPSTLEHKKSEVWFFQKGEKLLSGTLASELGASKSKKENRKEINHTSTEAVLERIPSRYRSSTDGKEMSERLEITMCQQGVDNSRSCSEASGSDYDIGRGRPYSIKRTSSLNESLDRYTELFERSFGRESKFHQSKSLKLTNEYKVPSSGRAPKFVRRRLSMPDLESFCSFLNEASNDAVSSEMLVSTMTGSDHHDEPKSVSTPVNIETFEPLDAAVETEFGENMIEGSESCSNIKYSADLIVGTNNEGIAKTGTDQEQEIGVTMNHSRELTHPCTELAEPSPIETCFPDDIESFAELPTSEGPESNPRDTHKDEPDTCVDQQIRSSTDSLPAFCSKINSENTENVNKRVENHLLHFDLDKTDDDADFNYVRDVLELSGFIDKENLGTWCSLDQPLDPLLFKELEACLHPELESYGEDVDVNCDHQLLFDLINETLLEIYERSFTYFPRAFSFNRFIRPMPKGHHLLEEVWAKISWYRNSRPELDQSMDDFMARDLAKGNDWMNVQFDTECVALELEDLIFDELLDELIGC